MVGLDSLLLTGLGVAGRALGAGSGPEAPDHGVDFGALLERARRGEVRTDLPVELGRGADVELSADELTALSAMADRAQAQGVTNALVLMDGKSFVLDVVSREVTGAGAWQDGVLGWVDGVIDLRTDAGGAGAVAAQDANRQGARPGAGPGPLPDRPTLNASLLRLLSEADAGA